MKRSDFLIFSAFYTVVSKRFLVEIALIMDTPFVETLLVLADIFRHFATIFTRHSFSGPFSGALKIGKN